MSSIRISSALLYLLLVVLGITAAKLTWKLAALEDVISLQSSISIASDSEHSSTQKSLNSVNIISTNHLFGQPLKPQAVAVQKPPPKELQNSKLDIRLTGLLNGDPGVAVIIYKGAQGAYLVDEHIVNSNSLKVRLASIHHNYVIIINNDAQERLSLPKLNTKSLAQTGIIAYSRVTKPAPPAVIQLDLNSQKIRAIIGTEPRKIISRNPLALSKFMKISPSIEQGKLRGYIISPGPDERLLQSVSIQPGDIITHLNGKAVAGLTLPAVYQSLNSNTRFKVTVDRNGTIITMDIKL